MGFMRSMDLQKRCVDSKTLMYPVSDGRTKSCAEYFVFVFNLSGTKFPHGIVKIEYEN